MKYQIYTILLTVVLYAVVITILIPVLENGLTTVTEEPHQVLAWMKLMLICWASISVLTQISGLAASLVYYHLDKNSKMWF